MASFCNTCVIDMDFEPGDLAHLGGIDAPPLLPGFVYTALCEGCGFIEVDDSGDCMSCDLMRGRPGHGKLDEPLDQISASYN